MSFCRPNYRRYGPSPEFLDVPDDCMTCSICGSYIDRPTEEIVWDAESQACHAECLEKEGEDGDIG